MGVYRKEYTNDITRFLDEQCDKETINDFWHHYVTYDEEEKSEGRFAIRVPGKTLGVVKIDSNLIITDIIIDTSGVICPYKNKEIVEEIVKSEFVGNKYDFDKDKEN